MKQTAGAALRAAGRGHGVRQKSSLSILDNLHVKQYAAEGQSDMTLKYALGFAENLTEKKVIATGQYVHKELPVRLAKVVSMFNHLPYIVTVNPHMIEVLLCYLISFNALRERPPIRTLADMKDYFAFVMRVARIQRDVPTVLAKGIAEAKLLPASAGIREGELDAFMDEFVSQRIGRRVIVAHPLTLLRRYEDERRGTTVDSDFLGVFAKNCKPKDVVENAARKVAELCKQRFGDAPEVIVNGDVDASVVYIPAHLEYILIEILKNCMRHTFKWSMCQGIKAIPPIEVTICEGRDCVIRISDQGGGFAPATIDHVWEWGGPSKQQHGSLDMPGELTRRMKTQNIVDLVEDKTKAFLAEIEGNTPPLEDIREEGDAISRWLVREHMRDMGALTTSHCGLPAARVYSRYLGGDVVFESLDGVGSHFYVSLSTVDFDKQKF